MDYDYSKYSKYSKYIYYLVVVKHYILVIINIYSN